MSDDLKDHLDNVRATHSDLKLRTATPGVFELDLLSVSNYYPFGMQQPARCWVNNVAGGEFWGRFGFNGKEKDDELKGKGNSYDYGARHYDPRLARFMSLDPMRKSFPMLTPYQFASNSPIQAIDLDGLEAKVVVSDNGGNGRTYVKFSFDAGIEQKAQIKLTSQEIQILQEITNNVAAKIVNNDGNNFYSFDKINYSDKPTSFNLSFEDQVFDKDGKAISGCTIIGLSQQNTIHLSLTENVYNSFKNFADKYLEYKDPSTNKDDKALAGQYIHNEKNIPHLVTTIIHEFGHTAGLDHQGKGDYDYKDDIQSTNLMYSPSNQGHLLLNPQFNTMKNTIDSQQNTGENPEKK